MVLICVGVSFADHALLRRLGVNERTKGKRNAPGFTPQTLLRIRPHAYTQKALCVTQKIPAVSKGDRVAQLILERILTPEVEEVLEGEELEVTKRGAGGYGSTGV